MVYFEFVIGFLVAAFVFKFYIHSRQWSRHKKKEINPELKEIVSEQDFIKAQNYGFDKISFTLFEMYSEIFEEVIVLSIGVLPYVWYTCDAIVLNHYGKSEILTSLLFSLFLQVFSTVKSVSCSAYSTFVIEERHGFNKTTKNEFIKDLIKGFFIKFILQGILLTGILLIIDWAGANFYIYVWGFLTVFILIFSHVYHDFIAPIFNTFTELEPGELRESIEELATRVGFPLKKVFLIDGSRRSDHSNAYFFGFWKNKRIVIFDTLLTEDKGITNTEILSILAHELGHWKGNHFLKNLFIIETYLFVMFYCFGFAMNNQELLLDFGFTAPSVFISLLLFSYVFSPVNFLLGIFTTMVSRQFEFQADAYSKKLDYGATLKSGLIKLFTKNSGNMDPDPFFSMVTFSHPPLLERLSHL